MQWLHPPAVVSPELDSSLIDKSPPDGSLYYRPAAWKIHAKVRAAQSVPHNSRGTLGCAAVNSGAGHDMLKAIALFLTPSIQIAQGAGAP